MSSDIMNRIIMGSPDGVNVSALSTDGSRIVIGNWSHSLTFGVKEGHRHVSMKRIILLLYWMEATRRGYWRI